MVVPVFLSTVTPGKLPTFWFNPVNTLKSELFPLLGLPTNAMFIFFVKLKWTAKLTAFNGLWLRNEKQGGLQQITRTCLPVGKVNTDKTFVFFCVSVLQWQIYILANNLTYNLPD